MEPDRGGRYPIHYNALEGRIVELAQSLAEGGEPSVPDGAGFTPLHFAAQSLNPKEVRLLIEAGADLDAENIAGISPRQAADTVANYDLKKYIPPGR